MENTDLMFVCSYTHEAGTVEPWHTHACHELVYYVSGKGKCVIEDKTYQYSPNQILYIPPHKKHEEYHDEKTEVLFSVSSILIRNVKSKRVCIKTMVKNGF